LPYALVDARLARIVNQCLPLTARAGLLIHVQLGPPDLPAPHRDHTGGNKVWLVCPPDVHTCRVDSSVLSSLSKPVRESAIIAPSGETRWPIGCILEAINEFADQGAAILGLDLWPDQDGAPTEVPFAVYGGGRVRADVEPARKHALEALLDVPEFGWDSPSILVTWSTAEGDGHGDEEPRTSR